MISTVYTRLSLIVKQLLDSALIVTVYVIPDVVLSLVKTVTLELSDATVKRPPGGLGEMVVEPAGTVQHELSPVQSPGTEITKADELTS